MNGAKTALIPAMRMNRRRSLRERGRVSMSSTKRTKEGWREGDARLDELVLVALAQEGPPDLAVLAEQEPEQAEAQVPLERLREHALAEPRLAERAPDRAAQRARERQREVEQALVEQGDEVVLLAHDAVGDVVCVEPLGRLAVRASRRERRGVARPKVGQARDDGVPRDRLDVALQGRGTSGKERVRARESSTHLGHLEQLGIELVHLPQSTDAHAEADDAPGVEDGDDDEDEQREARHAAGRTRRQRGDEARRGGRGDDAPARAPRDDDVGEVVRVPESRVVDAADEERAEPDDPADRPASVRPPRQRELVDPEAEREE